MKNKITFENGVSAELSQLELKLLVMSVQRMSEGGLTAEQIIALEKLRELFETVDF